MTAGRRLQIFVEGSASLACYFVKANWPISGTSPVFDVTSSPMIVSFDLRPEVVSTLVDLIDRGMSHGGNLATSCRTFHEGLRQALRGAESAPGQPGSASEVG